MKLVKIDVPIDDTSLSISKNFIFSLCCTKSDLDRVTGIIDLRYIIEFACLQVMKHLSRPTPKSGQIPAVYPCNIFLFLLKASSLAYPGGRNGVSSPVS